MHRLQGYRHPSQNLEQNLHIPLFTSIDNHYFQTGLYPNLKIVTNAESKVYAPNLVTYLNQTLIFEYRMFKREKSKTLNDHYQCIKRGIERYLCGFKMAN